MFINVCMYVCMIPSMRCVECLLFTGGKTKPHGNSV